MLTAAAGPVTISRSQTRSSSKEFRRLQQQWQPPTLKTRAALLTPESFRDKEEDRLRRHNQGQASSSRLQARHRRLEPLSNAVNMFSSRGPRDRPSATNSSKNKSKTASIRGTSSASCIHMCLWSPNSSLTDSTRTTQQASTNTVVWSYISLIKSSSTTTWACASTSLTRRNIR